MMHIQAAVRPAGVRSLPIGRKSTWPTEDFGGRVHVRRVRVNRDGMESDGTYWGPPRRDGQSIWNVHSECGSLDVYVRAVSREQALRRVSAATPFVRREAQ